ncbi:uncharacterized protein LOC120428543 [Culex pipiens pallens]|uniref:uncharacterized protein LOC120428543 n=1 Tax=Culex pipiens pallens TaxID=42434 RepID=UPI001954D446|nr:uncharacterized protein LOC120428543 [Culex pipiens pallens]
MDKWNITPFNFKTLPKNQLRDAWKRYRRNFEYMQLANQEKNKTRLRNIFLALAGPDVQEVFESIPGANVEAREGVDPCEVALNKLEEYFAAKYHDVFERNLFWTLKPEEEEPLEKFLLRVMDSAKKCNFGASAQESLEIGIIDKMILQSPPDLREKLLAQEKLTLEGLTRIVNAHGSLKHQIRQFASGGRESGSQRVDVNPVINRVEQREPPVICFRCGKPGHTGHDTRCPARNQTCYKCNKPGHFSTKCQTPMISKPRYAPKRKSEDNRQPQHWKKPRFNSVRAIEHHEPDQSAAGPSGQSNFIYNIGDGDEFLWVVLGGVPVQMLIDSGSQKNIVDDTTWDSLKRQGIEVKNVRNGSDQTFRPYGKQASPLKVLGMFDCTISIKEDSRQVEEFATFYVVKGGSQPLLGKTTAQTMGVLVLGLPSTNSVEVNKLWKEERHVFPKMKGIKLKIAIDESVVPVSQHARRPPLALMDKVEAKLKDLERNDIIEKVSLRKRGNASRKEKGQIVILNPGHRVQPMGLTARSRR